MILALDTTSEFGSIALVDGAAVVSEVLLHSPDGFAHVLYGQIERMLEARAIRVQDVDCFGVAAGPGSFTGVRVGLTAIKGLAEACGKRVAAVSNLQALACFGSAELRATVLDARRGEIYGAVYDRDLNLRSPEVVAKFPDWLTTLPLGDVELISTDPGAFAASAHGIPTIAAPRALAGAIGLIAARRFADGQTSDPAEIDANYIRKSDAELLTPALIPSP